MRQKFTAIGVCLAFCLAAIVATAQARSQTSEPLTGTWQCESHGGSQGDLSFTLDLQQKGENVTGSISTDQGLLDITSGSFKNGTLKFLVQTENNEYHVTGKYKNGKLAGKWTANGQDKGIWSGSKSNGANQ